jgi:hypothetical protein
METAGFVETLIPTRSHGFTSQKALYFTVNAVRNSDLTKNNRKKKQKSKEESGK